VELSSMRKVWFHVTTKEGVPIENARAHVVRGNGIVTLTDHDGNGWIESMQTIDSIRFVAAGFAPADFPVPPEEDSLDVRLERAATLTLNVTTAAGRPGPGTITVTLETSPSAYFVLPADALWPALGNTQPSGRGTGLIARSVGDARALRRAGTDPGDVLSFRTNTVCVGPLRQGAQMNVLVHEAISGKTFRKEIDFATAQPRTVDILLPGDYARLAGRVLEVDGRPVRGVGVAMGKKGLTRHTNDKGEFSFGAIPAGTYDLHVSSPKHAFWRAAGHEVKPNAAPMEIKLEAGVPVTVTVLAPDGTPQPGAQVLTMDKKATTNEQGRAVLEHLPSGLVVFHVLHGDWRASVTRDASVGQLTIQLEER
jgi:hypothetical protein